jgi:membrane associated rhomboid family serine protease
MSQQTLGRKVFSSLGQNMPRRNFNSTIDRFINKLIDKMPQGNLGFGIAALNTICYGLYLAWPQYNMYSFMNNFTFSIYGLNRGHFWNLITCHFTHMSFFSYLLDSGIIWLFC